MLGRRGGMAEVALSALGVAQGAAGDTKISGYNGADEDEIMDKCECVSVMKYNEIREHAVTYLQKKMTCPIFGCNAILWTDGLVTIELGYGSGYINGMAAEECRLTAIVARNFIIL